MSRYLEEAASLLRKAAADNENKNGQYESKLNATRVELAQRFADLAAIDKGLLPADLARDLLARITQDRP